MNATSNNPIRFWSKVSGISLIIMAMAAGYAYGVSFMQIYVSGDTSQTLTNIEANKGLYLTGAYLWCLILVTDLIVSYGFYRYLAPFHRKWAIASGILRFIYSIFLAIGIIFLFARNLENFRLMWSLGLIIIGFHLSATAMGALYSREVPKILVLLLIIAGTSYSLINGLQNFFPQAESLVVILEKILMIPMTFGEMSFGIWLLMRGGYSFNQRPSGDPVQDVL